MSASRPSHWQLRHCGNLTCRTGLYRVRRHSRVIHAWRVGLEDLPRWVEATVEPSCPFCGGRLSPGSLEPAG